jgi:ketosteroid isomerase-like protein
VKDQALRGRETIEQFIRAVNARDADAAQAMLAPGALLVFPGPTVFEKVSDFLAWAGPRYRKASYIYGDMDFLEKDEGTVVYAQGRVEGEFPDGVAFSGVRYIDRFTIAGQLILRKEVWSDMADLLRRLQR